MDPDAGGSPRISVIGIGSRLRRDDAVGWAVVAGLAQWSAPRSLPPGTHLHVCDGEPVRLVSLWEGADLAVVADAARAVPARPGTVHRLCLDGAAPRRTHALSGSHGLGLYDALDLAEALGRLPRKLVIYAIEAGDTSFGTGLTEPVAAAVGSLVDRIGRDLAAAAGHAVPGSPGGPGPG
jgi:hydrogenase maturation protease